MSMMLSVRVPSRHEDPAAAASPSSLESVAGAQHDAAAVAQLAEQRRQRNCRPDAAAAIAAALEAVAGRDDERIGFGHPASEACESARL